MARQRSTSGRWVGSDGRSGAVGARGEPGARAEGEREAGAEGEGEGEGEGVSLTAHGVSQQSSRSMKTMVERTASTRRALGQKSCFEEFW